MTYFERIHQGRSIFCTGVWYSRYREVNLIINMSFGDKNTVDVGNSEVSGFGSFYLVKYIRMHSVLQTYDRFWEVVGF